MRRFSPLAVILLLAACSDTEIPSALAPDDAALRAQPRAEEDVPIHISYRVTPLDGSDMINCATPEGDPTPVAVSEYWQVDGYLSYVEHLDGSESWAQFEECVVTFEGETPTTLSAPAVVHLESPDGDALDMHGTWTSDFGTGVAVSELTIVGGEGRFAGARGSLPTREYPLISLGEDATGMYGIGAGMVTRPSEIEGRPMKLDFTFASDPSEGTCDVVVPGMGIIARLPAVSRGTGQATHLGRSSATITHEWCRLDPERGIVSGGSFETTGASGAAVTGVWDGYLAEDGSIALTGWITDGTGRFTTSWGEVAIRGFSDPAEGGWFEADGRIVY